LYPLACGLVAAFAFAFNWATGHRGVFLLDQSVIFVGGWRILQGQTPYKDFLFPFGPVTGKVRHGRDVRGSSFSWFFAGGIALVLACFNLFGKGSRISIWREMAPASAIAILLPWFRSLTQATTENEWQNDLAFVGLAGCLGVG
jgi:hypothetical protein